jgi:hypothetical protein
VDVVAALPRTSRHRAALTSGLAALG